MNKKKYCRKVKNNIRKANFSAMLFPLYLAAFVFPSVGVTGGVEVADEFSLLKGQGVEVCEAYLKRLNQTDFKQPPYCDRPEVKGMTGFETLNRVYLTAEEIYPIYGKVESFWRRGNQSKLTTDEELGPDKQGSIKSINSKLGMTRLQVWKYDPMVDIDNDGKVDNIVIWHRQYSPAACGLGGKRDFPFKYAFAFDLGTTMIDEKKTRILFEHLEKGWPDIPGATRFRFIDQAFSVFKYKGITYFDAFPNKGHIESPEHSAIDLRVYKHKNQKTDAVCEYHWNGRK